MEIEKRMEALGIDIKPAVAPLANYVAVQQAGDLLVLSGGGPLRDGKPTLTGRLGDNLTLEQGYAAAREGAVNLICALKAYLGDLDRVEQVVKLLGFVRCTEDFGSQPQVINGASELLEQIFGQGGKHARAAVGVASLPDQSAVEVEMIIQYKR